MSAFQKAGVRIPEDIAIVGFSNWFMSSVISPKLTTIDQPGFLMGKTAFKQLFKEIKSRKKNKPIEYKKIELATELINRESTK
ncbi:lacI family transcriptional regulator [Nonlabens ulvanivorans]|nr:lacI family transcriptional regulator [Nonlabens ulvanivorans]